MALPKVKHPLHVFTVPSTNKKCTFRPFLVKEEKLLLMAKASEDPTEMFRAIKQNINNCSIDTDFDIDKLTIFDMEYLFLQIRGISVNNIIKVSYKDKEDEKVYDFEIDIQNIKVDFPEGCEKVIKITEDMGLQMKYPSASIFNDTEFFNNEDDSMYELIVKCVDKIYDGDEIYDPKNYTKEEVEEFMDDLGVETFTKITEFMGKTPKLKYVIEYKNSNGNDRKIELNTLTDFFTLG